MASLAYAVNDECVIHPPILPLPLPLPGYITIRMWIDRLFLFSIILSIWSSDAGKASSVLPDCCMLVLSAWMSFQTAIKKQTCHPNSSYCIIILVNMIVWTLAWIQSCYVWIKLYRTRLVIKKHTHTKKLWVTTFLALLFFWFTYWRLAILYWSMWLNERTLRLAFCWWMVKWLTVEWLKTPQLSNIL